MLAQQMPFAAVADIVGESARRVMTVCWRSVQIDLGLANFSDVRTLAIVAAQRSHHLRQVPCCLADQYGGGRDASHRAAHRQVPQRHALVAAQGPGLLEARSRVDLDALIAKMITVRTARAWAYKAQLREILEAHADQRCARHARILVHLRDALQGRTDEGRRRACASPFGGHRHQGADPSNQRLPGGHQWYVPGRQAPRSGVRPPRRASS